MREISKVRLLKVIGSTVVVKEMRSRTCVRVSWNISWQRVEKQ